MRWRQVQVFISSTFRDMHAERDYLVRNTFPRLRSWCEEHRLHFNDVDLRWGVPQDSVNTNRAIGECLRAVDRCRPFFVCFLGNRYGWLPDVSLFSQSSFPDLPADHSITHLEIIHAIDRSLIVSKGEPPSACRRVFFYFREPDCLPNPETLTELTKEQRHIYRDTFFERDQTLASKAIKLKQSLHDRFEGTGIVQTYSAEWDARVTYSADAGLVGGLFGLEQFGQLVFDDLVKSIKEEYADHIESLSRATKSSRWGEISLSEERDLHTVFAET